MAPALVLDVGAAADRRLQEGAVMSEPVDFVTVQLADGGTWTRLDRLTDVCQPCRAAEVAEMARREAAGP